MKTEKYILDIGEFLSAENGGELYGEALAMVDESRRKKAQGMVKTGAKAASLGAGLLLQFAVQRAEAAKKSGDVGALSRYTVSGLLQNLDSPLPLSYHYGDRGKPYLDNFPYYFSLSHSGSYVICALSEREVGADIQVHRSIDPEKVITRFFSEEEAKSFLRARDKEEFFYRLWTRKEAYAKLTGEGVAVNLKRNIWNDARLNETLHWEESREISGYSIALCQYAYNNAGPSQSSHNL